MEGGKTVTTAVDKSRIPVFVKGGTILPLAVDPLMAAKTLHTPLEIRIYPGSDAVFTLYEDDGHTNAYEQGKCSRITFRWNDSQQQLTIDERQGQFDSMPRSRSFVVQVVNGKNQTVKYEGNKTVIAL